MKTRRILLTPMRANAQARVSEGARRLGDAIRQGSRSGLITSDELTFLRSILDDEILRGQAPVSPKRVGDVGWIETKWKRCGKADCGCRTDRAKRHGPYFYRVWREGSRRRFEILGRAGQTKPFRRVRPELEEKLHAARLAFDPSFLL